MSGTVYGRPSYVPHPGRPHRYVILRVKPEEPDRWLCPCGALRDDAAVRRGRNNRKRGGRAELAVAREYGGEKVGPLGLGEDIRGKQWATQVKVSQRTPPPMWLREFAKLANRSDGRTPRIILRFTRQGVKSEDFVVVRGKDFLDWYGKDE